MRVLVGRGIGQRADEQDEPLGAQTAPLDRAVDLVGRRRAVESSIGLPVAATASSSGRWVMSALAIL